ncbi:MAG: hypothetical protein HY667_05150 [Chloroflexi bacterium]|nr:hypothetical protein [Chloroflexota bacterium]
METQAKTTEATWQSLSPDEKLEKRLAVWLSAPGVKFASPEAAAAYKERVINMKDAMLLRKAPARVPVIPNLGAFAEAYCGYSHKDVMYDVDKAIEVMNRCTLEFQIDTVIGSNAQPGMVYDSVDFKLYSWPGHGLADDADGVQYNEGEYMGADEYDDFIKDPTYYWDRTYLPKVMGAMEPLQKLYPLCGSGATSSIPSSVSAYGLPEVQAALQKMMAAGRETLRWQQKMGAANRRLTELGFPSMAGGSSKAPFDLIGDSMRGFRGIIMDMYQRPAKLLEAMESLVPILIQMGVQTARIGGCPTVGFALHKGADGFMSEEQFKTFYWAPLRKIILGLIEEGLIPRLGAQGGYNSRLEIIRDLPRGRTIWAFGHATDMALAKEVVGDVVCMTGNVPAALIHTGTPEEIVAYCLQLIETAGKGGGYMFSTAQGVNRNTKLENVRAMVQCAKEYAVHSNS